MSVLGCAVAGCCGVANLRDAMVEGVPNSICISWGFFTDASLVGGGVCICKVSNEDGPVACTGEVGIAHPYVVPS